MIHFFEEFSGANEISISPDFLARGSGVIEVKGRRNRVVIGTPGSIGHITVRLTGDNNFTIGETTWMNEQTFNMLAPGSISIGDHSSFNVRSSFNIHEAANIEIGQHCLLASDVHFSCSPVHKIFDLATGERVNPAGSIHVADRVWIAAQVAVWGGAEIGEGSVVGYGSLVNKAFPANCIVAGTPARVIREGVRWEP